MQKSTPPSEILELLALARQAYRNGSNITQALREHLETTENTKEIIEIAYDLQAGSYTAFATENRDYVLNYTRQIANVLEKFCEQDCSILDVGCGEATNLTEMLNQCATAFSEVYGCDISWSRLRAARDYISKRLLPSQPSPSLFASDIAALPLCDKSIDYVVSNHALEPNHGREYELLTEIFRVARKRAILFEPDYENADESSQSRMNSLGYIRNLREIARSLGASLIHDEPLALVDNEKNPTNCFIFEPPLGGKTSPTLFTDPGTDQPLENLGQGFWSPATGLTYPVIDDIPILSVNSATLTSLRRS